MPYAALSDLPPAVRRMPVHAQEIFRAAFNAAWEAHALDHPARREEAAFRIARAAVKRRYRKVGEDWMDRGG
ncbi:MAG TPA: ChaB family protein [Acetobacteraceae bacterium]|nr:ChaB family protein [Acetobacteraceae bacterium]